MSQKGDQYQCVCCGAEITKIDGMPNDKPWEGMWSGGIVERVSAGFGSAWDGDMYVLAICDPCIKSKYIAGIMRHAGNYMEDHFNKGNTP